MRKLFALAVAAVVAVFGSYDAMSMDVIPLNRGWKIGKGWESSLQNGAAVDLPHTWNAADAMFGDTDYYRGMNCYSKTIKLPEEYAGKRVFLKVNAAQTVADVYVDKKFVGQHKGGYTAFVYELTDFIEPGKEYELNIRVSNAQTMDIAPICGDFNTYGGLYRGVDLLVTDDRCINPAFYASPGVLVSQNNVSKSSADIGVKVLLSQKNESLDGCTLDVVVRDGDRIIADKKVKLSDAQPHAECRFAIKSPRLWQGVKDPHLYTVQATLRHGDTVLDSREEKIGLRSIKVDPDKGFFLNGEPYRLNGANMHQDRAERASAYRNSDFDEDLEIVKEMGCNAMRLSHYPHAKYLHHKMDSLGIIAWSEIPFVNIYVANPDYEENLRQQLKELVYQNYNHASIPFWGLFNEINGGWMDDPNPMVTELVELAKSIDPSRPVTGASNQDDKFNGTTDFIAFNRYFGWYGDEPAEMGRWLDREHGAHPERSIGISEYGAGASVWQQSDSLVHPEPWGQWHPENWQTYYHIENWRQLQERQWLWCNFIWCMFDFGAAGRREGDTFGRNDKGLVTYDRKIKKDAYYFYKANWNKDDKFLYIASKRNDHRSLPAIELQVFSNCGAEELTVNGKSYGVKSPDEVCVITWDSVPLSPGENRITVTNDTATDTFTLYRTDAPSFFR